MADQWEMCTVFSSGLYIYSPGQTRISMSHKEYALLKGDTLKYRSSDSTFSYLLEDGWEPYTGVDLNTVFFKRKYQG
jgi:hypothetical protein